MSIVDGAKITKLQHTFPKLTETNQQYVLGLTEGLKYAQNKAGETPEERTLQNSRQQGGK
jgi:hypothetical protein